MQLLIFDTQKQARQNNRTGHAIIIIAILTAIVAIAHLYMLLRNNPF